MKAGAGKNKGSSFEREVGKKISLWLSNGERPDLLCRTVLSGGQFTYSKFSQGNAGDLMAQHPSAFEFCDRFTIECKHWRDLELIRFLNEDGGLYDAMVKVQQQARALDKSWWLVAKQNHRATILLMPAAAIVKCYATGLTKLDFHSLFSGTVYMYTLDSFLKAIHPSTLL